MTLPRTVAALLAAPLLTLAACGGSDGDSDKEQIEKIVKDGAKNPATICDHLDPVLLKAIGGTDGCKKAAKDADDGDDKADISNVDINGDKATAKFKTNKGEETVNFIKKDGDWKVTATK